MSERTDEGAVDRSGAYEAAQKAVEEDCERGRADTHRLRNELYSATLALRTVIALIDRGDVKAAREAAERMLEQLCGPAEAPSDPPTTARPDVATESP